ncbi:A24 family peptidase [Caldimonas tepidiphila]|uniref:A24 family peptidase n=1 Tax=Caldimonas tepidiphila TaxID=2315841 RepID=UPI000E5B2407|nr:prepilin peptidase [Caldimonas tepidiphila]
MQIESLFCFMVLTSLLAWITLSDLRSRRIPNLGVTIGIVVAMALHTLPPQGDGLFSFWWGGLGPIQSMLGLALGLALFMPLYLLGVMGAGDVKLLGMVGAWLGPKLLIGATLLSLLAGGVLAVGMMVCTRSSRQVLINVRLMLTTTMVGIMSGKLMPPEPALTTGRRLPYALAIGVGTLSQVALQLFNAAP